MRAGQAHLPVLGRIGVRTRHCRRPGCKACWVRETFGISPAELTAMALVLQGLGPNRIAGRMGIQSQTARAHLQSCYRKLGCDNILGLALWAIKNGCDWRSLEKIA